MRSILTRAALTLATGAIIAIPLANAADDATVSALWGPGSEVAAAERATAPINAPAYGDRAQADMPAGCVNTAQPADTIPSGVVVVTVSGDILRLTLDDAAARSATKDPAASVWVVGTCA